MLLYMIEIRIKTRRAAYLLTRWPTVSNFLTPSTNSKIIELRIKKINSGPMQTLCYHCATNIYKDNSKSSTTKARFELKKKNLLLFQFCSMACNDTHRRKKLQLNGFKVNQRFLQPSGFASQ